jgi:hypothetical protein
VLLHASLLLSLLERRVVEQLRKERETALAMAPGYVAPDAMPAQGPPPHADLLLWQDANALLSDWCPRVRDLARLHCQRERAPGRFVGFKLFGDVSRYGGPMPPPPLRFPNRQRKDVELLDQLERDRYTVAKRLREQFFLSQADMRGKLVLVLDRARIHPLSLKRTVQILDRWFWGGSGTGSVAQWPLYFDRYQVYLLASSEVRGAKRCEYHLLGLIHTH